MIGSDKLTDSPFMEATRRKTVPGMASWGGEGPAGTTCRECSYWSKPEKLWQRWFSSGHERGNSLQPQRCQKACGMMNRSDLPKVEHYQESCRFFVLNPEAPPVSRPAK